jgi:hypothetical protein
LTDDELLEILDAKDNAQDLEEGSDGVFDPT